MVRNETALRKMPESRFLKAAKSGLARVWNNNSFSYHRETVNKKRKVDEFEIEYTQRKV